MSLRDDDDDDDGTDESDGDVAAVRNDGDADNGVADGCNIAVA